jgi:hypothetical protein
VDQFQHLFADTSVGARLTRNHETHEKHENRMTKNLTQRRKDAKEKAQRNPGNCGRCPKLGRPAGRFPARDEWCRSAVTLENLTYSTAGKENQPGCSRTAGLM